MPPLNSGGLSHEKATAADWPPRTGILLTSATSRMPTGDKFDLGDLLQGLRLVPPPGQPHLPFSWPETQTVQMPKIRGSVLENSGDWRQEDKQWRAIVKGLLGAS